MKENIKILLSSELDMEWVAYKYYSIMFYGSTIGYVKTFTFTKKRIEDSIAEDFAFYMSDDTRIKENICNLMYENMGDTEIVYIDQLFLQDEYRRKGIGSIVLKEIEHLNTNCAFMLLASALENIHEFIENEDYRNKVMNKLYKFYENNEYKHHGAVFYKRINFTEKNWIDYDSYNSNEEY